MALTRRHREIIDFEREWWHHTGSKESAIQAQLSLSSSTYYRLLARVVDDPEAMSYDPLTVKRVRRQRDQRRRERYEGRRAGPGST